VHKKQQQQQQQQRTRATRTFKAANQRKFHSNKLTGPNWLFYITFKDRFYSLTRTTRS